MNCYESHAKERVMDKSTQICKPLMWWVDAGSLNALHVLEWKAGSKGKDGCQHWLLLKKPVRGIQAGM